VSSLPASVRLALWATASYAGRLPVEEVMDRALPDVDDVRGDVDRLGLWRDLGERVVLVALPRPGDLSGMPRGSADLVAAATDAGECVFVPGIGGALVPTIESFGPEGDQGTQVTWTAYDAEPVPVHTLEALSLNEVDLRFRQELAEQTRQIAVLDAQPWAGSPARGMVDDYVNAKGWGLPDGLPQRALRVMSTASVISLGTGLGLQLPSPALTSDTDERRRGLLASLLATADRAVATAATVSALTIAGMRPGRQDA
jgi:hypothetical protein